MGLSVEWFWWATAGTIAFFAYPFVLYPALLRLIAALYNQRWAEAQAHPSVSIVIAAHNEASGIARKLTNVLAFQYPSSMVEIIVVSDGSTDDTDAIVSSFAPRVRLLRTGERVGKQVAVNRGVDVSRGEVLIFTDVGLLSDEKTLERLTRGFADPSVGAVSATVVVRDQIVEHTSGFSDNGEGSYLGWDARLRFLEGLVGTNTGCCGLLYAVRRSAHKPFAASSANDLASALDMAEQGWRSIVDPESFGFSRSAGNYRKEFRRKVRTIVGGLDTVWQSRVHRWGWRRPLFLWMLLSHKVARWLSPPAALAAAAFIAAGALSGDATLRIAFGIIVVGAMGAALGLTFPSIAARTPLRHLSFALISLLAGTWAWVEFLGGKRYVTWGPTHRDAITAPTEESSERKKARG